MVSTLFGYLGWLIVFCFVLFCFVLFFWINIIFSFCKGEKYYFFLNFAPFFWSPCPNWVFFFGLPTG